MHIDYYVFSYTHNPLGSDQYDCQQMRPTWGSLNPVEWRTHGAFFYGSKPQTTWEESTISYVHSSSIIRHYDKYESSYSSYSYNMNV